MLKWKTSITLVIAFASNSVFANSNELAKCVHVNAKAASLMADAGNSATAANFRQYVDGATLFGKNLYGAEKFSKELASTKNNINSKSTEQLVEMMPRCIELANSLAASMSNTKK